MIENNDQCLGDDTDRYDNDDNKRSRQRHSRYEKDGDNNHKRQRPESKQHRQSDDNQVDGVNRTGTSTNNSTSSCNEDLNEKRRKRRHSKKKKHRKSDGRRKRNEDDDDDSHSHSKKSSKKKYKTAKLSDDNEASSRTNHPIDYVNTQRTEQALLANPTMPLPEITDHRPSECIVEAPPKFQTKTNMIPMTRQQYEYEQSQIRSVYDPESGRIRLIRGSGEIIESIVNRSQHQAINQIATRADGQAYTKHILMVNSTTASKKR